MENNNNNNSELDVYDDPKKIPNDMLFAKQTTLLLLLDTNTAPYDLIKTLKRPYY